MLLDSALIDTSSKTLLSLSPHAAAAIYLSNNMRDTTYVAYATYPNYRDGAFLASMKPEEYPNWAWSWKKRIFSPTRTDVISDDLRHRSQLAVARLNIISQIILGLSAVRNKIGTGVTFQETVYLSKRMQAREFKEAGYDEDRILEFPYVLQYADFADMSLKQAADDILFAARLDDELLLKTELQRLTYFHRVADAKDAAELARILESFYSELSGNALT